MQQSVTFMFIIIIRQYTGRGRISSSDGLIQLFRLSTISFVQGSCNTFINRLKLNRLKIVSSKPQSSQSNRHNHDK